MNVGMVVVRPVEEGVGVAVALAAHAVVAVACRVVGSGGRGGSCRHRRGELLLQLGLPRAALMLNRYKKIKKCGSPNSSVYIFLHVFQKFLTASLWNFHKTLGVWD